jgi:hypothetical protein
LKLVLERKYTKEEDTAYSIMGLLDTYIHPLYGEGKISSLKRLLKEYISNNEDPSFLEFMGSNLFNPHKNIYFHVINPYKGKSVTREISFINDKVKIITSYFNIKFEFLEIKKNKKLYDIFYYNIKIGNTYFDIKKRFPRELYVLLLSSEINILVFRDNNFGDDDKNYIKICNITNTNFRWAEFDVKHSGTFYMKSFEKYITHINKICKNWENGYCKYGIECNFTHNK